MTITVIDILLLAFMVGLAVKGTLNGFIMAVIGILGIILAFLFSFMVQPLMVKFVSMFGLTGKVASISAYIIGFLVIYVSVLILGHLVQKVITFIHLGWLNRLLGFVFGFLKGAAIASIILWGVFYILPKNTLIYTEIKNSKIASYTMKIAPFIYEKLNGAAGFKRINPFN